MNLGMPEMIFIFLLALLLFGPKKLPQVGRELGKALTEFKRASNEFKSQLEVEIEQAESAERDKAADPPKPPEAQLSSPAQAQEPQILPPAEPTVAAISPKSLTPSPIQQTMEPFPEYTAAVDAQPSTPVPAEVLPATIASGTATAEAALHPIEPTAGSGTPTPQPTEPTANSSVAPARTEVTAAANPATRESNA